MPSDEPPVRLEFAPEFNRNVRTLSKKYRHMRFDVETVIERLPAGEFVGDGIVAAKIQFPKGLSHENCYRQRSTDDFGGATSARRCRGAYDDQLPRWRDQLLRDHPG